MFIKKELREYEELLLEELESEVDCSIHDTRTMSTDRVGYMPDVDCVKMLVVTRPLNKNL